MILYVFFVCVCLLVCFFVFSRFTLLVLCYCRGKFYLVIQAAFSCAPKGCVNVVSVVVIAVIRSCYLRRRNKISLIHSTKQAILLSTKHFYLKKKSQPLDTNRDLA